MHFSQILPRMYSPPAFTTASPSLHYCFTRRVWSQLHNCKSRLPTLAYRLPIACQAACPCRPRGSKETRNVVGKIDEKRDDQFAEDSPRDERLRSLDRNDAGILHHPIPARYPESREGAGECEMTKEKKG